MKYFSSDIQRNVEVSSQKLVLNSIKTEFFSLQKGCEQNRLWSYKDTEEAIISSLMPVIVIACALLFR